MKIYSQNKNKTRINATIQYPFKGIMQQISTLSEDFNQ